MTAAVETFRGLEHAMELVAEIDGVRFVNDSKATNVESALRSIESFDDGTGADHGRAVQGRRPPAASRAAAARAKAVVAIGEARALVREALAGAVPVHEAASLEEAVGEAFALARPSGVVLLAPACASFDMFRDYAERGTVQGREVEAVRTTRGRRRADPAVRLAGTLVTVSGEQSSVGLCGEGLAAGNAGCPGLRSWCLHPRPTDDC